MEIARCEVVDKFAPDKQCSFNGYYRINNHLLCKKHAKAYALALLIQDHKAIKVLPEQYSEFEFVITRNNP